MPGQETDIKRRVAGNIALAIERQGMTIAEIARRIGGHERQVRRWRDGEGAPDIENLAKLAAVLNRDITWFYEDHDEEPVAA